MAYRHQFSHKCLILILNKRPKTENPLVKHLFGHVTTTTNTLFFFWAAFIKDKKLKYIIARSGELIEWNWLSISQTKLQSWWKCFDSVEKLSLGTDCHRNCIDGFQCSHISGTVFIYLLKFIFRWRFCYFTASNRYIILRIIC